MQKPCSAFLRALKIGKSQQLLLLQPAMMSRRFYTTVTPSGIGSQSKVLKNPDVTEDNKETAVKIEKGALSDVQETRTFTDVSGDAAAAMAAAKDAAERSAAAAVNDAKVASNTTQSDFSDSSNEQQDEQQQKKRRYVGPLLAGLSASLLCYLFIHNTLTTQAENIIFHIDTVNTIKTMEQIEAERRLLQNAEAETLKKKRDAALDYHRQNMSYEQSAWLKFTRAWNSIWKNISVEIDKQYQKENDDKVRKEEERKRLRSLGSDQGKQ